jgi:choline-sulfatase
MQNLLLITIDTLRPDVLSVYGSKARTPFFDEFAQKSVVFDQAYTSAPLTLPAHTSLLTGLYPPSHGVRNNGTFHVPSSLNLLSEIAKQNGMATGAVIGGYPLAAEFGLNQGFDSYDSSFPAQTPAAGTFLYAERGAAEVRVAAEQWLSTLNGKRYFLWLHFFDPHHPYVQHANSELPNYVQEVLYVDQELRLFFEHLRQNQLDRGTMMIVVADHGEAFEEHREISHSLFVYNTTLHIPLMISVPGISSGRRSELVRIIDLFPTVLEAFQWKSTNKVDGVSLMPLLKGQKTVPQENYAETLAPALDFGWSPLYSIQDLHHKFIQAPRPEFYDLDHDPKEERSRIETIDAKPYIAKIEKIRAQQQHPANPQNLSQEEREKLQSLGYFVSGATSTTGNLADPKDRVDIARAIAELSTKPTPLPAKAEAYAQIVKQDPGNPLLLLRYGETLLSLEQLPKAADVFQQVIQLRYPSASAYNGLAAALFFQKKMDEAEKVLMQAVAQRVADGETYYNLAEFAYDRKENAKALENYKRSMSLGFLRAYYRMARLQDAGGNHQEALKILDQAESRNPSRWETPYERGVILFRHGQFPESVKSFEKAVHADPTQTWLNYNLGVAYLRAGNKIRARECLRIFLDSAPKQMAQEKNNAEQILAQIR